MIFFSIAIWKKVVDNTEYVRSNDNNDDEIVFNNYSRSYCICIINIVDFAKDIDKLKTL